MQVLITAPIRCWMSDGLCPRRSSLLVRVAAPYRASRRHIERRGAISSVTAPCRASRRHIERRGAMSSVTARLTPRPAPQNPRRKRVEHEIGKRREMRVHQAFMRAERAVSDSLLRVCYDRREWRDTPRAPWRHVLALAPVRSYNWVLAPRFLFPPFNPVLHARTRLVCADKASNTLSAHTLRFAPVALSQLIHDAAAPVMGSTGESSTHAWMRHPSTTARRFPPGVSTHATMSNSD